MQILWILSVPLKFTISLMSFFKAQVIPTSKFASFFSVMTYNSSALCGLRHNILSTKVGYQSANFQTCYCSHWNSPNSSCHWNQKVRFSLNFASLFRVIKRNSPAFFHLRLYMLWTKWAHQSANFQTFDCSHES